MCATTTLRLNPWTFTAHAESLECELDGDRMARLTEAVVASVGAVHVRLQGVPRGGQVAHAHLRGQVTATLPLQCQRCLTTVDVALDLPVALAPLRREADIDRLDSALDPLLLTDDTVDVLELAEDELLLGMPLVAMHADEDECRRHGYRPVHEGSSPEHPFAVLSQLKR